MRLKLVLPLVLLTATFSFAASTTIGSEACTWRPSLREPIECFDNFGTARDPGLGHVLSWLTVS